MMRLTVRDIMNGQLLYVLEDEVAETSALRRKLLRFGVSGVPVLDSSYRPVGFVSLRDLPTDGARAHVSHPVVTTREDEPVEAAARALAEADLRHLVVVDQAGRAVGVVSALDFVRALAGVSPRHPARFDVECGSGQAFPDEDGR